MRTILLSTLVAFLGSAVMADEPTTALGRKLATDRGNTFYRIPASELDNWIQASASLYDEWVADMDKRGANGKQLLQDARELLVKYRK